VDQNQNSRSNSEFVFLLDLPWIERARSLMSWWQKTKTSHPNCLFE
jgi:hypothetical protein